MKDPVPWTRTPTNRACEEGCTATLVEIVRAEMPGPSTCLWCPECDALRWVV